MLDRDRDEFTEKCSKFSNFFEIVQLYSNQRKGMCDKTCSVFCEDSKQKVSIDLERMSKWMVFLHTDTSEFKENMREMRMSQQVLNSQIIGSCENEQLFLQE